MVVYEWKHICISTKELFSPGTINIDGQHIAFFQIDKTSLRKNFK